MNDLDALAQILKSLDGHGYRAYKRIEGAWVGPGFTLLVDHVQPDPFATPTRLRVRIPHAVHGLPQELWANRPRRTGALNYLLRVFKRAVQSCPGVGSGRSCQFFVDAGGTEVLERAAACLGPDYLELRFRVGLPARGRTVLGGAAARLLTEVLPEAVGGLRRPDLDEEEARRWADLTEDHAHLQAQLERLGLVAFVRDGSLLPRASGVSDEPLADAVPFESPPALRVTLDTLHHGPVTGMGLPEGVTVITGGGFHGKTTLLEALERGVYPHVPGDGREWVVTRSTTVKLRSEDGRAVTGVHLTPFVHDLPLGASTDFFSTADASGSTSLAAAVQEALEVGAQVLLLDEDTSATNLLVRDARMQRLVKRETITPLIDRVRELYERLGVSTVLVTGGNGDYLDVASRVLLLENYRVHDATEEARNVVRQLPTGRSVGDPAHPLRVVPRIPEAASFDPRRGGRVKIKAQGVETLLFGRETLDLRGLEQLVDPSQTRAIGHLMAQLQELAGDRTLAQLLTQLERELDEHGLHLLDPAPELARPRRYELAGAINRLRSLRVRPWRSEKGSP
ncbi:ABC-ATPase domain-containing protein [Oceanithermus sp.]